MDSTHVSFAFFLWPIKVAYILGTHFVNLRTPMATSERGNTEKIFRHCHDSDIKPGSRVAVSTQRSITWETWGATQRLHHEFAPPGTRSTKMGNVPLAERAPCKPGIVVTNACTR